MPSVSKLGLLSSLLVLAGCATPVLQQRVPVASEPPGALARDDSGSSCRTPCALDLDRNRDHIVMLELADYESQDVVVRRQYRTADVLLSAINSGLNSARTFNNASWALQSGINAKNAQEQSGAAYDLEPSVISVRLRPQGSLASPATPAPAQGALAAPAQLIALLARNDQNMLEQALERSASGQATAWDNVERGLRFSVVPDNVELRDGQVVRPFTLSVNRQGQWSSGRYLATRVGRAEWQVLTSGLPAPGAAASMPAQAPWPQAPVLPLGDANFAPVPSGEASGQSGVDVSPGTPRSF
ncbi:MAG: hypothetical protein M0R28_17465 [Pigmentiphaga sp.]|nr:hypothetical protein [Pigmentiphaga sp.]